MAKDMKKKCLHCGKPELLAMVTINKAVPLADKNGTLKIGGQKIGQMDLKNAWDKIGGLESGPDQMLRGPIICGNCETEHFWVVGDKKAPLRIGSVVEAREIGHQELLTQ